MNNPKIHSITYALIILVFSTDAFSINKEELMEKVREDEQERNEYCTSLYKNNDFGLIHDKVSIMKSSDTSFEMMTIQSKPSKQEKKQILVWAKIKNLCGKNWMEGKKKFTPPFNSIYLDLDEAVLLKVQLLRVDLYNGGLSYGEHNRQLIEIVNEYKKTRKEIAAMLSDKRKEAQYRAKQLAMESKKAAAKRFQLWMQQRAANRQSRNKRFQTTCTSFFNTVTCE